MDCISIAVKFIVLCYLGSLRSVARLFAKRVCGKAGKVNRESSAICYCIARHRWQGLSTFRMFFKLHNPTIITRKLFSETWDRKFSLQAKVTKGSIDMKNLFCLLTNYESFIWILWVDPCGKPWSRPHTYLYYLFTFPNIQKSQVTKMLTLPIRKNAQNLHNSVKHVLLSHPSIVQKV